ncbi:MAG: hypothetical protein ACOYOA_10750 [Saprospiraceae bacterium]
MVTFTFFTFEGFANRWWSFTQMGLRSFHQGVSPGLQFAKMLGTGGGNGFSIYPNFGQYGWLGVWDSAEHARTFFQDSDLYQKFKSRSSSQIIVFATPLMAHGKWDGQEPFTSQSPFDPQKPVAVLTRATIKKSHLINFWRYVPKVSQSIETFSSKTLFHVGVGELPLVQQATFSIWKTGQDMMDYAYKSPLHAEVVKKTRELGWYSEELFARFEVLEIISSKVQFNLDSGKLP